MAKHYITILILIALITEPAWSIPFSNFGGGTKSSEKANNFFHYPFGNNNGQNPQQPSPSPSARPSPLPSSLPSARPVSMPSNEEQATPQPSEPSEDDAPVNNPTTAPTKQPSAVPTVSPTKKPTAQPTKQPTPAPMENMDTDLSVTLVASHQFRWSAMSDDCSFVTPDALIACLDGGFIDIEAEQNAECTNLNADIKRCKPINPFEEAVVNFHCVGMMDDQLTARAEVLSSEISDCTSVLSRDGQATTYGGDAMVMGGLGRYCKNGAGGVELNADYSCVSGLEGVDDFGEKYCVSDESCSGESACGFDLHGLTFIDFDYRPECLFVAEGLDLSDAEMYPSTLTSFHFVEWTYSAEGLGCEWTAPPVTFTCSNGGEISLDLETSYFCDYVGSSIECAPPSGEDRSYPRISHYFSIWCSGETADQLDLTAVIDESESSAYCQREGLAIQGVHLSRACGDSESDDFQYEMSPTFCSEADQYYDPQQGLNPICVEAFQCGDGSCNSIDLPRVVATSSDYEGTCIYAY